MFTLQGAGGEVSRSAGGFDASGGVGNCLKNKIMMCCRSGRTGSHLSIFLDRIGVEFCKRYIQIELCILTRDRSPHTTNPPGSSSFVCCCVQFCPHHQYWVYRCDVPCN